MTFRFLLAAAVLGVGFSGVQAEEEAKTRSFRLEYGATLSGLEPGATLRVWLPVPKKSDHQQVRALKPTLPAEAKTEIEPKYKNKILSFEVKVPEDGKVSFSTPYRITRNEVLGLSGESDKKLTGKQRKLFLQPNSKVPTQGRPLQLLTDIQLPSEPLELAKVLYERVDEHVRYDKSQPGYGNGDVLWVCDSQFGNCTDFHSLFISLARANDVPARFEIGFPLPEERGKGEIGGYHCWALFFDESRGWVPVDISEADKHPEMKEYYFGNLTENRVTFTVGRDIDLVPQQEGPPLNFFVYPYAEVNGKSVSKEHFELEFSFRDVKGT